MIKKLPNKPPPHPNPVRDCEREWWLPDSPECLDRLMNSDQIYKDYVETQGWNLPGAITYKFNSMGYRGHNPDWSKPTLMTFGCSITMGIGLPQDHTWPWVVGKALNLQVVNFSLGGQSADWCFRMAEYWLSYRRPVLAVMLAPPHQRLEIIIDNDNTGRTYSAQETVHEQFLQTWFTYDENVRLNNLKNKLAFLSLGRHLKIPTLCYDAFDWFARSREEVGFARDYMHPGIVGHKKLADQIIYDWNETQHS